MKKGFIYLLLSLLAIFIISACAPDTTETPDAIEEEAPVEVTEEAADEIGLPDAEVFQIVVDGIIGEGEYPNSYQDSATGLTLFWHNDQENLYIGLKSDHEGWSAIGFDPEQAMQGANIILVAMDGEDPLIRDDFGDGMFSHKPDQELGGTTDILSYAGQKHDSGYSFEFAIPLDSGDEFDKKLESGQEYDIILAVHASSIDFDVKHTSISSASIALD